MSVDIMSIGISTFPEKSVIRDSFPNLIVNIFQFSVVLDVIHGGKDVVVARVGIKILPGLERAVTEGVSRAAKSWHK